jgi:hypothetical protein
MVVIAPPVKSDAPYQPTKFEFARTGVPSVIVGVSTLYEVGVFPPLPPFRIYVMLYAVVEQYGAGE